MLKAAGVNDRFAITDDQDVAGPEGQIGALQRRVDSTVDRFPKRFRLEIGIPRRISFRET